MAASFVGDAELGDALAECEAKNGDAPITVFEIETAAAFLLFSRHPADVLLLEVGLGGRLDATNVVERPLASIITRLSLDHREFLGDTIEKIAAEKAGILKRGVPAIVAGQPREALAVIERQAARLQRAAARSPARTGPRPRNAAGSSIRMATGCSICRRQSFMAAISSRTPAPRSRRCASSGLKLPAAAFEAGMTRVDWPARMQRLSHGRLAALAPPESELWLDGGHNADGGQAIAAALADLEERVSRPLVLIVGMLATKDSAGFLKNFSGLARRVITVPIHQDKAVPAAGLADGRRRRRHSGAWRATISKARSPSPASSTCSRRRAF